MISRQALRRTISAGLTALSLAVVGVGLSAGGADAATRSPWDAIAQCESGGNWSINTGNGYFGGLQFSSATWAAHGGRGSASTASRAQQIKIGERVVAAQGWGAWSSCSARLGLQGHSVPVTRHRAHHRVGATAAAKKVATCTAADLKARFVAGRSAGGTRYGDLRLTNTGAHRCRLAAAPRAVHLSAGGRHHRVVGVYDFEAVRPVTAGSRRSHFLLAAHGGHVYSRVAIASATRHGARCRPVDVTALVAAVRGGSGRISAPVTGIRLRTCGAPKSEVLRFGQYRAHRSTAAR